MAVDSELTQGFASMLGSIDVPGVSLARIHQHAQVNAPPQQARFAIAAAAAALLVAVALPIASPGVVQTLAEKIAAILHWTPPSAPTPRSVYNAMKPHTVTLEQARARVTFTVTAPVGLPADASGATIMVAPTGVFSRTTRTWRVGPSALQFFYRRSGGRSFVLTAVPASTQTTPPSKYMFEDRGVDAAGNPILVRYDRFVWRNGDQIMSADAGDGISAAEIGAIESAMHGTPVPTVWPPVQGVNEAKMRVSPPH
jgi:hypothetical protein